MKKNLKNNEKNMEEFEELIKDKEIYILGKTSKDFRIGFDEDILILKPDGTYEYIESIGESI